MATGLEASVTLAQMIVIGSGTGVAGFMGKVFYDWITAGRQFVTKTSCREAQEMCPVALNLAKYKASNTEKMIHVQKELVTIKQTLDKQTDDISFVRTALTVLVNQKGITVHGLEDIALHQN